MSIISVSVPVPTSGDGPAVDIANLVGSKSIVLNGLFSGQYVLLAGHELGVLVPVLQFDAGGEASIAQTLPDAYQYVAVRAQINTRPEGSTPVTMVVNAVEGDGQNFFATLASLVPGSFGPQPSRHLRLDIFDGSRGWHQCHLQWQLCRAHHHRRQ